MKICEICETSICKPKGRFFRSVRLYLTDIMIDICRKWRIYLAKKRRKGLLHLAASAESGLYDLSDTNLLACWLVDPLTSLREGAQKKSGTCEGARPEWSYSIDMCYIKLVRVGGRLLRGLCLRRCFRT